MCSVKQVDARQRLYIFNDINRILPVYALENIAILYLYIALFVLIGTVRVSQSQYVLLFTFYCSESQKL